MNTSEFNGIVEYHIKLMRDTLTAKGLEYARGDRLHNFKVIAQMRAVTPEDALVGLMSKHWVSILDMVNDLDADVTHPMTVWYEKIGDVINYLLLLKGLLVERQAAYDSHFAPSAVSSTAMIDKAPPRRKP